MDTDKHCVLPTTCHRQGLKFFSPSQSTQPPSKGSSWLGWALQRDGSRSQPQPGFPYSSDSVPQALKAEMLLRALHFSAPMHILAACPSPAFLLVPWDSEPHLPQILRAKKKHGTSCPSAAGISSVSKERLEHQGAWPPRCPAVALAAWQVHSWQDAAPNRHTKPQGKDRHPSATPADPLAVVSVTACHFCIHRRTQGLLHGFIGLQIKQTRNLLHQARCPELLLCVPLP